MMRCPPHLPLPGATGGRAAPGSRAPSAPPPAACSPCCCGMLLAPLADALLSGAAAASNAGLSGTCLFHVLCSSHCDDNTVIGQVLALRQT